MIDPQNPIRKQVACIIPDDTTSIIQDAKGLEFIENLDGIDESFPWVDTFPTRDSPQFLTAPIAIIPAKATSERCPGKNLRLMAGLPLFLHAVRYARQEGFVPIVSTDSAVIATICREEGVRVVKEKVDDRHMANCVRQVLAQVSSEYFAILQPTSPLRVAGMLRRMFDEMKLENLRSSFTAQHIKMVGLLEGRFYLENREQDASRFFRFFDGNLLLVRSDFFATSGGFFEDSSRTYKTPFPCWLQIDTEAEFATLAFLAESPGFPAHLPAESVSQKKVCIVSNKCDLKRNYSEFVDSCDVVMRISKMDNLDTGLTGKRTDVALVSCFHRYFEFSREARHVDELKSVPEVYFLNEYKKESRAFVAKEGLTGWRFMPGPVSLATPYFTTLSKGVALADHLFPDALLYFLGDCEGELRAPPGTHPFARENLFIRDLIARGRLVPMLEEDQNTAGIYSKPVTLGERWKTKELCLMYGSDHEQDAVLEINHPQWSDRLKILGDRARRRKSADAATVEKFQDAMLILRWDRWPTETFVQNSRGVYHFQSEIFQTCARDKESEYG